MRLASTGMWRARRLRGLAGLAAQCRRVAREARGAGFCAEVRSSNATGVHEPCGQILRTFSNKTKWLNVGFVWMTSEAWWYPYTIL